MIEKSDVMKKYFNKKLVMTKKDNEDFENSFRCQVCYNAYIIDGDVKVRNHCHATRKYRDCAYKDCNINVKLNHKTSVVFHDGKTYDSHLIRQELQ